MQWVFRRFCHSSYTGKMTNIPPRKVSVSNKVKEGATPLQILLQMGFPKHRALKALAATGNRSVQLASDWLLTHVNDSQIDNVEPREYVLYASPKGPLLSQLLGFWEKSKEATGWNGAHNFPPHITLASFFKAPDETSLQLAKAVKQVIESVGEAPNSPLTLEPYVSHNFMGLFVSEEHADYLKRISVQYVKQVSSLSATVEPHVKSLHITLAYRFDDSAYDNLKSLVDEMQPCDHSSWELRLYSRDPRFVNHQVHKVTQGYVPQASDELELVLGDYVYVEEKEFASSPDGWVQGTSWLTGLSGCLPAIFTQRTAESDAWTLHRAVSLGNNTSSECKSESDSNTDSEMASNYPHEDAIGQLGHEKSEETYRQWSKFWNTVVTDNSNSLMKITEGVDIDWNPSVEQGEGDAAVKPLAADNPRRWIFAMRHGERVDLTFGQWVPYCFSENGTYTRKDLNLPLKLGNRVGGKDSYALDTPLTRIGRLQAQLVGEGLRLANVTVKHVYASCALRCVETAQAFLEGLQADPSVKIRVEPGLFEYKMWHTKGLAFMTPLEMYKAGLNVDLNYRPYIDLESDLPETLEDYYMRGEKVAHAVVHETEREGGNIMFVGHAATLDVTALALKRLTNPKPEYTPYKINPNLLKVPYCALAAVKDKPWEVVCPPCPPSINSSSGRFDWRMFQDI